MSNEDLFICIDHVAYACPDADEASKYYQETFGWHELHREENPEQGVVEIMMAPAAKLTEHMTQVQVMAPLNDESTVAKWLAKHNGRAGLHHMAWRVDDIDAVSATLREMCIRDRNVVVDAGIGTLHWQGTVDQKTLDEAVSLAADDALIGHELHRVEASITADDLMAMRALHRAGFRREGRRRQAVRADDGSWHDALLYARLIDDQAYGPGGFTAVMDLSLIHISMPAWWHTTS